MRERVAYLIDQKVEKRVREFMDEFRKEIYQELNDQRRQNEEHIQYYASQKLGPLPPNKQYMTPGQPMSQASQQYMQRPAQVYRGTYSEQSIGSGNPGINKSPTRKVYEQQYQGQQYSGRRAQEQKQYASD